VGNKAELTFVVEKPASGVNLDKAAPTPALEQLAASAAMPVKPRKSLIEEELTRAGVEAGTGVIRRVEGEFNPLQPPGFSAPSYGTPGWVFVAIGVGVVAVIGVVVALIVGGGGP
jgi:hypothetical protein